MTCQGRTHIYLGEKPVTFFFFNSRVVDSSTIAFTYTTIQVSPWFFYPPPKKNTHILQAEKNARYTPMEWIWKIWTEGTCMLKTHLTISRALVSSQCAWGAGQCQRTRNAPVPLTPVRHSATSPHPKSHILGVIQTDGRVGSQKVHFFSGLLRPAAESTHCACLPHNTLHLWLYCQLIKQTGTFSDWTRNMELALPGDLNPEHFQKHCNFKGSGYL